MISYFYFSSFPELGEISFDFVRYDHAPFLYDIQILIIIKCLSFNF